MLVPGEHTPAQAYTWACLHLLPLTHSWLPTRTTFRHPLGNPGRHKQAPGPSPALLPQLSWQFRGLQSHRKCSLGGTALAGSPFADETLLFSASPAAFTAAHAPQSPAGRLRSHPPTHAFTQSLPVGPSLSRCCRHPRIFWPLVIIPLAHCLPNA